MTTFESLVIMISLAILIVAILALPYTMSKNK